MLVFVFVTVSFVFTGIKPHKF